MYQQRYRSGRRRGTTRCAWRRLFTSLAAVASLAGVVAVTSACSIDWPEVDTVSTEPGAPGEAQENPDGQPGEEGGEDQQDDGEPDDGEEQQGGEGQPDGGTGDERAPLTFTLDLEGYVPYADRFAVHYTIDGTEGVHGFCGFSEEGRCRSTQLYSFSIPSVRVGAELEWHLSWVGSSEFTFGHTDGLQHDTARTAGYTCTYPRSPGGNPQPDCRPDLS